MESLKSVEEEDYWNTTANRSFNFDEDDGAGHDFTPRSNDKLIFEDTVSESSYDIQISSGMSLRLLISDADLKTILEEQSRDEPALPKTITLEEEVRILRREHQERLHPPPVEVTVSKMILGKYCSLEMYKSVRDKEELLDEAVRSSNGDSILHVVLFLSKTLKKKLFYKILQIRPIALAYYVNYLKLKVQIVECMDLHVMLGKNHEAALIQFEAVQNCSNPETKKNKLKRIYTDYFSQPGCSQFYSNFVATYTNLLEFQLNEKLQGTSGSQTLPDSTVLDTLRYVLMHNKWSDASADAPTKFSDHYQVLPAQFEWVALNEKGRTQAWRDVEALFEKKSWHTLKAKSFQIHVPIEKVILQLHGLNAPVAVLNHFLAHIDEPQRKLMLGKKVGAVKAQIDSLVAMKDKNELEALKESLALGTEERFYAENATKNLNASKWKPDGINKLIR